MNIRKGIINFTDDKKMMQTAQIEGLAGEVVNDVERYQPFGLSTVPCQPNENGEGAECIIVDIASSSNRVVIATEDRRYRPRESHEGDVMLYSKHDTPLAPHNSAEQRIVLTDDGTSNFRILLKCGSTSIEMKSDGTINIYALTLNINANTNFTGTLNSNGKNISNTHTHINSGGTGTGGVVT